MKYIVLFPNHQNIDREGMGSTIKQWIEDKDGALHIKEIEQACVKAGMRFLCRFSSKYDSSNPLCFAFREDTQTVFLPSPVGQE